MNELQQYQERIKKVLQQQASTDYWRPGPRIDHSGEVYGHWTVLSFDHKTRYGNYWLCRSACGEERVLRLHDIQQGRIRKCLYCRRIDKTGERFGKLIVLGPSTKAGFYLCRCDCGVEEEIAEKRLCKSQSGRCRHCSKEHGAASHTTHGLTKRGGPLRITYDTWASMKQRCYNSRNISFKNYGAKGVSICKRWLDSVEAFLEDMGPRPSIEYTIDRIDPYGNYEPDNCRWADKTTQSRNTRIPRSVRKAS